MITENIDWRTLFGKYLFAAELYNTADDIARLLEHDISDEEMAAIERLRAEASPPAPGSAASRFRIPLSQRITIPISMKDEFDTHGSANVTSITATPDDIVNVRLEIDWAGWQAVVITPIQIGDATITVMGGSPEETEDTLLVTVFDDSANE